MVSPPLIECRVARVIPTLPESPLPGSGLAFLPTERASTLTKARALELSEAGDQPDPADLLFVKLRPSPGGPWRLSLRIDFSRGEALARELELEVERADLDESGRLTMAFLCVYGPESASGIAFDLVHVLDVSEGSELGHAPSLSLSCPGSEPVPVQLGAGEGPPPNKVLELIELEDALFRTNSAVVLPGGTNPEGAGGDPGASPPGGVGVAAVALRHLESHPSKRLLVAGHTDTVGSEDFNEDLSLERARAGASVVLGERERFVSLAQGRHKTADYQQILAWIAETFAYDCDPGAVDGVHGAQTARGLRGFQQAYNDDQLAGNPSGEALVVDGLLGPKTWGALFDLYEKGLRAELGVDAAGLAQLRAQVQTLDPAAVGCSEHHPIEGLGQDDYRSQANRRVELLFFDPGEEPALACHAGGGCDPAACDLYRGDDYERRHLPAQGNAKGWTARWERPGGGELTRAQHEVSARLALVAPGLAGESVHFQVEQEGYGAVAELEAVADAEGAGVELSTWFYPAAVRERVHYEAGQQPALARFRFTASAQGRSASSPWLDYADDVDLRLTQSSGALLARVELRLVGPWGSLALRSDAEARVQAQGIPPGGARLALGDVFLREEAGA